jgi:enterochelin esterase-like enzyme
MSAATKTARTQVWMENLGDWSWPGTGGAQAEVLPPSWVPAFPPRVEPVASASVAWEPQRSLPRTLALGMLLSAVAAASVGLALKGPLGLERLVGYRTSASPPPAVFAEAATPPLPPTLTSLSSDEAGSSIDSTSYASPALGGAGSFLVYLPPGYASTTRRYPVIYLLHGNSQPASAFLQVGLQGELDRLISHREIPPVIAVMIQGGPGANNWRGRYESYVLEVQELVDRMLPTVASRDARAIAGDSMGGYGAMNVTLGNPYRFGVVESWLGFFNGLDGQLRADRPILARLGLHAFLYGAESDRIADPSENPPFAAALRGAGASARSAIYPGGHSLETVEAHLGSMLAFAGRELAHGAAG